MQSPDLTPSAPLRRRPRRALAPRHRSSGPSLRTVGVAMLLAAAGLHRGVCAPGPARGWPRRARRLPALPPPAGDPGVRGRAEAAVAMTHAHRGSVVLQAISAAERQRRCGAGAPARAEGAGVYTPSDPAGLTRNKAALLAAAARMGASDDERQLLIAMAMMETENMALVERDICKDGTLGQNITAMNISRDLLLHLGLSEADVEAIIAESDDVRSIALGATQALRGLRQLGRDTYILRLRAGYGDTSAAKLDAYCDGLAATRAAIAADPSLMADGRRYGTAVDHVT